MPRRAVAKIEETAVATVDISNLPGCTEEARAAYLDGEAGPDDPVDFSNLRGRLEGCKDNLPSIYQEQVVEPFVKTLDYIGKDGFDKILRKDPKRWDAAGLMLDIAHSILQRGEGYKKRATDAFQEVVSDLYDGFLSAEDRIDVKPPDLEKIAPLVKWGCPDDGPYTWPADDTISFAIKTAVVNMPPANARYGILAWGALPHETAGHDIIHADVGLRKELKYAIMNAMEEEEMGSLLPGYWASRVDESASDVMGILNAGPAVAVSLIGFFRALNAAWIGKPVLRNIGSALDPHPADILRAYLASSTVRMLEFDQASQWADIIMNEADKDLTKILLGSRYTEIKPDVAKKSAEIVAQVLVKGDMECLEGHSFGDIQTWRNEDEDAVMDLRSSLTKAKPVAEDLAEGYYAAHVVAAAIMEGASKGADTALLFSRMLDVLKIMHDRNPSWGTLSAPHAGNFVRMKSYIPLTRQDMLRLGR